MRETGNVLAEVKAARDAVKQRKLVVQIGTQHRSEPYQLAAREVVRSGVREFSSGIADQWMSHGIDLVHFFMNEQPPRSVMASGGVHAWHDGRENPDPFQALAEYRSFLVSYSTSFGNDCDSFSRIMGKKATLVNIGGEGSPRWKLVEEKGNHEDTPTIDRPERWVTLRGDDKPGPINIGDEDLSHLTNWFECLRGRNAQTNATVDHGYLHSVACIMAAQSYWQRKSMV